MKLPILEYLCEHKDQAITTKTLQEHFGIRSRVLQHIIRDLRKAGHPITSGDFGYMYTKDVGRLNLFAQRLLSASVDMIDTANLIKKIARQIEEGGSDGPLFDGQSG